MVGNVWMDLEHTGCFDTDDRWMVAYSFGANISNVWDEHTYK